MVGEKALTMVEEWGVAEDKDSFSFWKKAIIFFTNSQKTNFIKLKSRDDEEFNGKETEFC